MSGKEKEKQPYRKPEVEKRVSTEELQRDAKYAGANGSEPFQQAD